MNDHSGIDTSQREILLKFLSGIIREIDEDVQCLSRVRGPGCIQDLPRKRLIELALAHYEMHLAMSKVKAAWEGAATDERGAL